MIKVSMIFDLLDHFKIARFSCSATVCGLWKIYHLLLLT
ncbi:hypothetical protein SACOL1884 [Staphylococcus aureus subsp. aureus COL]|uniref:Uncharacterized protein n=1 Tax=Staphylococcus aureus (strain COL) TaxID=93062 RepID=A0A0H2X2D7_STAAC|nr:hypothetical protein SACOL1884 [Staphylococcus aureus subsp. aureus COL]